MRKQPNTVVDIFQPGELRTLHINQSIKPLDDIRVRQAIAAAINVDDLVRFVGKDVATRACSVVPPGYLGEDCSAGTYAYSVDKAKALLAEAGYANGLELERGGVEHLRPTAHHADHPVPARQSRHQAQHERHGPRDLPVARPQGRQRPRVLRRGPLPTAEPVLNEFYRSRAIVNTPTAASNFSHCRVADAEIEAASHEPDPAKQKALWAEAQRKIHEDVCAVPLYDLRQVWMQSPRLDLGYKLMGSLSLAPPITEASRLLPP